MVKTTANDAPESPKFMRSKIRVGKKFRTEEDMIRWEIANSHLNKVQKKAEKEGRKPWPGLFDPRPRSSSSEDSIVTLRKERQKLHKIAADKVRAHQLEFNKNLEKWNKACFFDIFEDIPPPYKSVFGMDRSSDLDDKTDEDLSQDATDHNIYIPRDVLDSSTKFTPVQRFDEIAHYLSSNEEKIVEKPKEISGQTQKSVVFLSPASPFVTRPPKSVAKYVGTPRPRTIPETPPMNEKKIDEGIRSFSTTTSAANTDSSTPSLQPYAKSTILIENAPMRSGSARRPLRSMAEFTTDQDEAVEETVSDMQKKLVETMELAEHHVEHSVGNDSTLQGWEIREEKQWEQSGFLDSEQLGELQEGEQTSSHWITDEEENEDSTRTDGDKIEQSESVARDEQVGETSTWHSYQMEAEADCTPTPSSSSMLDLSLFTTSDSISNPPRDGTFVSSLDSSCSSSNRFDASVHSSPEWRLLKPKLALGSSPCSLRRSTRTKVQRLHHHLGQNLQYRRCSNGTFEIVGISDVVTRDSEMKRFRTADGVKMLELKRQKMRIAKQRRFMRKNKMAEKKKSLREKHKQGFNLTLSTDDFDTDTSVFSIDY